MLPESLIQLTGKRHFRLENFSIRWFGTDRIQNVRYMEEYCPPDDEKMILFQDDDTVVNEKDLEKFIINPGESISTPFCLDNWSIVNSPVIRPGDKKFNSVEVERWSVTREIYPKNFYPPYCSGTCYAISSSYARKISRTAALTNPDNFHHDDVLFTGILRVKAAIDIATKVDGICTHYNKFTKIQDIKNVVLQYCIKNNILESLCIIQ